MLRGRHHPTGDDRTGSGYPDVSWHGVQPWQPDWSEGSRLLAFLRSGRTADGAPDFVYVVTNAHWEPHVLALPSLPNGARWHRFADTSATPPDEVSIPGSEPVLSDQQSITVGPRAAVALVGRPIQPE